MSRGLPDMPHSPVAVLMHGMQWPQALGEPQAWPPELRTLVELMLRQPTPVFIAWGPELRVLYNDAYLPILDDKHPDALGQPLQQVWAEAWDLLRRWVDETLAGRAQAVENVAMKVRRHGAQETAFFSFSMTPIHVQQGAAAGLYCSLHETTREVADSVRLRTETEQLRELFAQAPGIVTVVRGPDYVFEFVNPAAAAVFGGRELIGHPAREVLPELVNQGYFELLDLVYRTGVPYRGNTFPAMLRNAQGVMERHFFDFVYQPLRDAQGRVTGIFSEGVDVTERTLAQEALKVSDVRLRFALQAGRLAAWEGNFSTGETWWSPEMFALHGMDPHSPPPQDYFALIVEEDREHVRVTVDEALSHLLEHTVQYRIRWPDGSVHWLEGSGHTRLVGPARHLVMVGVCRNIDARKRDESDLRFIADASAELAVVTDYRETLRRIARLAVPHFADWCTVDMLDRRTHTLERLAVTHVDPHKVELAQRLYERFQPNPDTETGAWRVIRTAEPLFMPRITDEMLDALLPNAEYRAAMRSLGILSYMAVPLVSRGRVLGAISFVCSESGRIYTRRDLANTVDLATRAAVAVENAELVEALRRSDAAKDVFLASLAHELRNPLAPITTALGIVRMPGAPEATRARSLDIAERQVRHLVRLVDDLLEMSRITRGKIELRPEVVDLRAIVGASADAAASALKDAGLQMAQDLGTEPLNVRVDPARMKQVVDNLLNNAVKYTPAGGRVVVQAWRSGTRAMLSVGDTGAGIPPDMIEAVFDMFTQVDRTIGRSKGGLGIGLALVRQLVQLHGGNVAARSPGLDMGATFTVELPLASGTPALRQGKPSAGRRASARRVLVIDDNTDAADTLSTMLTECGHVTETAYDGGAGLQAAKRFHPEVALVDIGMPGMDGHAVARALRAMPGGEGILLVAVTGWGQPSDRAQTRASGFDVHLTKPVTMEEVLDVVERRREAAGAATPAAETVPAGPDRTPGTP